MTDEQRFRLGTVLHAVARLRGRGIQVKAEVVRLYVRYAAGPISRAEVQRVMQARAGALGGQRRCRLPLPGTERPA